MSQNQADGAVFLQEFKNYANQFKVFVEREQEIKQLMYAVLCQEHILLKGLPGCLTGDSMLNIRRGNKVSSESISLKSLYEKWNGTYIGRNWRKKLPTHTLALKDGYIGYHEIDDVIYSGVKKVYLLITESGKEIKVTNIHPFKVPNDSYHIGKDADGEGFVKLKDLQIGDEILVRGEREYRGRQKNRERRVVHGVKYHPYAWTHSTVYNGVKYEYKRIHYARLVAEAYMNKVDIGMFIDGLRHGGKDAIKDYEYLSNDYVVHHKDLNPMNDNFSNLQVMSKIEHDKLHIDISRQNLPNPSPIVDKVAYIHELGSIDTYDIIMKEPYRNFIANDFIVHNTAKSEMTLRFLGGIKGAKVFKQQFTAFMDESYVFGPQLIEELKKGFIKHNIKNSLADASYAFLDEFFNANEETIVSCNEALNERTFTRNGQYVNIPLITAVMTTNQSREEEKKLKPIYDRILFTSNVLRVADKQNRKKLYQNALGGKLNNFTTFDQSKISKIHEYIHSTSVSMSDGLLEVFDLLLKEFQQQASVYISDRKAIKSLHYLKVCVLAEGKATMSLNDLEHLKLVWLAVNDAKVEAVFDACFVKIQKQFARIERTAKKVTNIQKTYDELSKKMADVIGVADAKSLKLKFDTFINASRKTMSEIEESDTDVAVVKKIIASSKKHVNKLQDKVKELRIDSDEVEKDDFEWFKSLNTEGAESTEPGERVLEDDNEDD